MKAKPPTAAQKRHWACIIDLGQCAVGPSSECRGRLTIHHCGTGMGGRKNHSHVLGLCEEHHQGKLGIDGKDGKAKFTKRTWQEHYGTEIGLMVKQQEALDARQS